MVEIEISVMEIECFTREEFLIAIHYIVKQVPGKRGRVTKKHNYKHLHEKKLEIN